MGLALSILWILAAFVTLWGLSLVWRGLWPRAKSGERRSCPSCGKGVEGLVCGGCGYEGESDREFRRPRNWRLILGGWIPVVAGIVAGFVAEAVRGWASDGYDSDEGWSLGPVQAAAVGVAVFAVVLGVWAWRGDRSRGRRRCPKCWYDMSGSKLVCPECGHDAKVVKRLYRPRRRKRGLIGAAALLVLAYGVWIAPRVREGGPVAAVPTWVLIAGLPWWPDWLTIEDRGNYEEDWTLSGRFLYDRMWGIEEWALRHRARWAIKRGPGVRQINRIAEFLDEEEDKDLSPVLGRALLRALVGSNRKEVEAVPDVGMGVWRLLGRVEPELIRSHQPQLMNLIADENVDVSWTAAGFLGELGADSVDAVPLIMKRMKLATGQGGRRRTLFVLPLIFIATESDAARHVVAEGLRDEDPEMRVQCLMVLGRRKVAREWLIDEMLPYLEDPDPRVSEAAADAVCRPGLLPDVVLPRVFEWAERGGRGAYKLPGNLGEFKQNLNPYMYRFGKFLEAEETRETALFTLEFMLWDPDRPSFAPVLPYLHALAVGDDAEAANKAYKLIEQFNHREERRSEED